jgi:hypothetical protein
MPDFSPIITQAYLRILGRSPDPSGLAHFNGEMNKGRTEAEMREALLRSPEYAQNHPSGAVRGGAATRAKGKGRVRPRRQARASRK